MNIMSLRAFPKIAPYIAREPPSFLKSVPPILLGIFESTR